MQKLINIYLHKMYVINEYKKKIDRYLKTIAILCYETNASEKNVFVINLVKESIKQKNFNGKFINA